MSPSPQEELFERALSLPPSERLAWIAGVCVDNPQLRTRLELLLRAHDAADGFLEVPPSELISRNIPAEFLAEEKAGDRIGRYKLLQKIGEGGCGSVYLAEQEESVRRRVALKVIKLGMDTRAVIARFDAERQALARMEHANIARVLDAGATSAGRPYFVMELVRGVKITEFCDQHNLSTNDRLELFIKVCQAIRHAHQKSVIHRDIKPSNILVTMHDGQPVPKVIDFGIAKATQGRLTEQTLFTAFEQFIGTPAYVSPEQAELSSVDVDTRSDIYSLGVLLYELLTGRTPFDTNDLVAAGIDEMRRRIREQEPPRPSHRLRTLNEADRTTVARRHGTDAPRLSLRLQGDLDWIVMRCLEKDRERRYETANGLAMDIQRHLSNEPVTARPPSTAYIFQKLVRRHRVAFGAGTAIAVALVAGFAVSTMLFLRERAALQRALDAESRARSEQLRAETATANEARERAAAEAGRQRVQTEAERRAVLSSMMIGTLKEIGLLVALGNDPRAQREFLDQTAGRKKELEAQPEVEAGVDEALGGAYLKLGEYLRAEELFREALDLRIRAHGKQSMEVAESLNYLGFVYSAQSRWADAKRYHQEALRIFEARGRETSETAKTHSLLGWVLAQQGTLSEAELHLRRALAQQEKVLGPSHRDVATTLTRLGSLLTQDARLSEAEEMLRNALSINERAYGRQSLDVAGSLNFLAVTIVLNQPRIPEAIGLYREAFEIRQKLNASKANPSSATIRVARSPIEPARPGKVESMSLESMLAQRDSLAEVEAALRDAQLYTATQYGRDSWEEAFYLALRVWVMVQEKKFLEAEPAIRQCLAIREKLRPEDWSTHHARHLLGAVLAGQLRPTEAESLLVEGYLGMKRHAAEMPEFHQPRLGESAERIIQFYRSLGRTANIVEWTAEFDGLDEKAKRMAIPTPLNAASPEKSGAP